MNDGASQTPNQRALSSADQTSSSPAQSQDENDTWIDRVLKLLRLKLFVALLPLVLIGLVLIHLGYARAAADERYYLLREIGGGLLISGLIGGAARMYFAWLASDFEEIKRNYENSQLNRSLGELITEVSGHTTAIRDSAKSLIALNAAEVDRVYENRHTASADISRVLETEQKMIKIIGNSMNDLVRDDQPDFRAAWSSMKERLRSGSKRYDPELEVRLLLVDPNSDGAYLRAEAQSTFTPSVLYKDVELSMQILRNLLVNQQTPHLQVKVYKTTPVLYLAWTPSVSFFQPYYFRPTHEGGAIPVLRLHSSGQTQKFSMHAELDFHFDWVWNHASVPLLDWMDSYERSWDSALRKAGIKNVFYDSKTSLERILRLIENPETKRIWLKGATLHSFFEPGRLYGALLEACKRQGAKIRIMLIDPSSEQARLRCFREFLVHNPGAKITDFDRAPSIQRPLFYHMEATINAVSALLADKSTGANVQAKLFRSGPEMFMILTDKSVLVEQYHYGKLGKMGNVAEDVPLFEYEKLTVPADSLEHPYSIFEDHYDFVWKHCASALPAHPEVGISTAA